MKTSEFEAKFETGEDLTEDLDLDRARRVNHIVLTAWKGGTFGLRVREADRDLFAGRCKVMIILPGIDRPSRQVTANITQSWNECPELRSAEIGRWLKEHCLHPWPKRQPPKFEAKLSCLGEVVVQTPCDAGVG